MPSQLIEYIPGQLWLTEYPVRYFGTTFHARMTIIRLRDRRLMIHSPCQIDDPLKQEINALGTSAYIIAPGLFHFTYLPSAQAAFPTAKTFLCPGVERKLPRLEFEGILGNQPDSGWKDDLDQALLRGSRFIWEVAFLHRSSRTLILVDLLENFTDATPGVSWTLKLWWKVVFRMWNRPKPAPEYQLSWKDKTAAKLSLQRILDWDFQQIIIAHGDLVEKNAKEVLRSAWKTPLEAD